MPGAIGFGLLLLAAAALVWTHGTSEILGLPPEDVARLAALLAVLLMVAGSVVSRARGGLGEAARHLGAWGLIFAVVLVASAYRAEIAAVADRTLAELRPGRAVVTEAGEVSIRRGLNGSFLLEGVANGEPARFVFDTGANVVVLTAETARRLGYGDGDLSFRVPVSTANGRTLAAPITLDTLAVGPIEARRVRALVARPGALSENLLGMTFLDRLASYEVRRDELILRAQ